MSHRAQYNLVIGNFIGTLADGNSTAPFTANDYGLAFKDDPIFNYFENNVIGGNKYGIWNEQNYTGCCHGTEQAVLGNPARPHHDEFAMHGHVAESEQRTDQ